MLSKMVKSCCAYGCSKRWGEEEDGKKLRFFKLPNIKLNLERRKLWIAAINRENWTPHKETVICGLHFFNRRTQ